MFPLLAKIIPLDLAATLSPGIFAVALILLGSKLSPKIRTLAFLTGSLMVGIAIALLGLALGQIAPVDAKHNLISAIVDLVIGFIFIIFGIKLLISREKKIKPFKEDRKSQIVKWLVIGIIISATNFDALFLSFTAAKEVGSSTEISILVKIILLIVNIIFFTLPITLPLLLYLILPDLAGRILTKINQFVVKYSQYLVCALFIIFGIILLYRGMGFL